MVESSCRVVAAKRIDICKPLSLGLERAKRLVEQFQDVHWIVLDCNQIATATQFTNEQQGKAGSRVWALKLFVTHFRKREI